MHVTWPRHFIMFALRMLCALQPFIPAVANAQSAPATRAVSGQGEDAARELALTYSRVCLAAFPNEAALQKALASFNAVELNQADVRSLLHDDPGRGWRLPDTPFTVTVEAPPYRTCAVRRMTRDGLPTAKPYIDAVNAYTQQRGLLKGPAQRVDRRLPNGADTMLIGTPLLRPGTSQAVEVSIYAATNYHGRFDPARSPDAAGGVGVEVRLAHQLVAPP